MALVGGVGTFVVWLLAGEPVSVALFFAITVVVVTCPDAFGAGYPDGGHGWHGPGCMGVLFKNATAIETSKKIDVVVMDKTGTLTLGAPEVTDLIIEAMEETDALALIAAASYRRDARPERPIAGRPVEPTHSRT